MRDSRFDNLKGFLIFLVVMCHFFELFPGTLKYRIYIFVYSFHMPLFVFISGYFAKFNIKNTLTKLLYPYIIFQILYCLFMGNKIQFIEPYWILWYLCCLILWSATLVITGKKPLVSLLVCVILALVAGYFDEIGKPFALSRFICLYPFFLSGHIAHKEGFIQKVKTSKLKGSVLLISAFLLTYIILPYVKTPWLYHSQSYSKTGQSMVFRLLLLAIAFLWCAGFLLIAPKKKIPFLAESGRYSICIFLLHGFIVKAFDKYFNPFIFSDYENIFIAILFTAVICIAAGNKYVYKWLSPVFVFPLQNAKNVIQYIITKKTQR